MPTNLPEIKQLLADWSLLAMDNPLFIGVLVVIVWILAAVIYNFKILLLNKKQKVAEQAHLEVQNKLVVAEQQVKQQEQKALADAEQMAKHEQLVVELQDNALQRKQIMLKNIKSMARKFDLSEQLVGADDEMKDEFVWQQQDNIIQQLADRLGVVQQEIAKGNEKDSLISNLQDSLDKQIQQFAQLEQAIEVQKHVQQEQQKEVQQQLANTLEKHQLDFSQLIETVQNRSSSVEVEPQIDNIVQDSAQQQELKTENIVEQQIVEFSAVDQVSATNVDTLDVALEASAQKKKDERIVSSSAAPLVEPEAVPESQQDSMVQDLLNIAEPTFSTLTDEVVNQPEASSDDVSGTMKSSTKVAGKFKNLLGKVKKRGTKIKPEKKVEDFKLPDVEETIAETVNTDANLKVSGKFKSLLGKVKKTRVETVPEEKVEALTVAEELKVSGAEQKIETFIAEDFKASEAEEVHVEPDYGASSFKVPGAFKKIFGKARK